MTLDADASDVRWSLHAAEHLFGSADVKRLTAEKCVGAVVEAAKLMAATFRAGGKVVLCGNGGSAADCQHMAAELVGRFRPGIERPGLAAVALTTDSSIVTAYANDVGFDAVFARQVQALGRAGDVLVAISTSGASRNVLRAADAARSLGMRVVALTGNRGSLAAMADVAVEVPSDDTQHIQEAHLAVEHAVCVLVEDMLFGGQGPPA
jgi:D-sedoheptulose 7-phosphate isomerase